MRESFHPSGWGVRTRSAVVAMLVVSVVFAVAGVALIVVLQRSLQRTADAAVQARVAQVVGQLGLTRDPALLDRSLLALTGPIAAVSVFDTAGQRVVASEGAPDRALITATQAGIGSVDVRVPDGKDHHDYRVVGELSGDYLVIAASEQEPIGEAVAIVELLLAVGLPLLVGVVGVATHLLVGRSLRPVEGMRSRAAAISTAALSERLPLPGSRDEIGRLASTLNSMLDRLEAGHQAQRRFVGDASHELRSPLATLSAALELGVSRPELLDENLISTALLPEARRMQRLVDDLLLLAKADERGLPLRLTDVDVDDLVETERARRRGIGGVEIEVRAHPVQIRGDHDQLARVVRNLVDNALMHARSTVAISCEPVDGEVVVRVADDGPGVPAADRDRIFERFVRLDAGRTRAAGGSGLGLAIVAEIVTAHEGSAVVGTSEAGGALFEVRLPLAGPQTPPPAPGRTTAA